MLSKLLNKELNFQSYFLVCLFTLGQVLLFCLFVVGWLVGFPLMLSHLADTPGNANERRDTLAFSKLMSK